MNYPLGSPSKGHGGSPKMLLRLVNPLLAGDYELECRGMEWWRDDEGIEYFDEIWRVKK